MDEPSSADLVARWRTGDEQAAAELFRRYFDRLRGLARSLLSAKLSARLDAEDVIQSVYRSFFEGVREERYVLERGGDLWRLLTAITLHKVQHQVARHTAAKRSVTREESLGQGTSWSGLDILALAQEPSPSEALAVVEELDLVLRALPPLHRTMVEQRLQGFSVGEISAATDRSERLVRLVLEQVHSQLQQRYQAYTGS
jgi:RNA polymerase sigma-70 factor (ECF subfamily)